MEENTEKSSEYNDYSKTNQQYLAEEDRPLKPSKQENFKNDRSFFFNNIIINILLEYQQLIA